MEWTEETIQRLRALWQEGHSTAEIGRRMGISKNAVVGKAHRLQLPARPSPIRREPAPRAPRPVAPRPTEVVNRRADPVGVRTAVPPARTPADAHRPVVENTSSAAVRAEMQIQPRESVVTNVVPLTRAAIRPDLAPVARSSETEKLARAESSAERAAERSTRRLNACCWPLGEPGTKAFRFCGCETVPTKPYCLDHAQLAYVRIKDRRESVA